MKTIVSILLPIALLPVSFVSIAQDDKAMATKNIIESQRYIFKAETVSPATGQTRQLTSEYTLKISIDSVVADLPYFGRAYSAPVNISGGGINFTSVKFDYTVTRDKKNRWEIVIKTHDVSEAEEISLTVFENGKASLNAKSTNRQPITFYGYITSR